MKLNKIHVYEDIINMAYVKSDKHPSMSQADRAAQFAPFAALPGHKEAISEASQLNERRKLLDEHKKLLINEELQKINFHISDQPTVKVTYFLADANQDKGSYKIMIKRLKRIDEFTHTLIFIDHTSILMDDIYEIEEYAVHDEQLKE